MKSVYKYAVWALLFLFVVDAKSQDHQKYQNAEQAYKDKEFDSCKIMLDSILVNPSVFHDSTLAATYKLSGDLYLKKYELAETVEQYEKADALYAKLGRRHAEKQLNVVNKIGICYAQQDNLIMTAKYFQQAYDIAIQTFDADDLNVGKATNNLATVYLYIGDFEKSLKYFYKSAAIKEEFADANPISLGKTYENISTIYGQINQMREAEVYLQKAGQLYQKDTVASQPTLLGYYLNVAGFYLESERVDEALTQLQKGASLSDDYKADKLEVLILQKLFGEVYLQKEDYAKAFSYFKETERLVKKFDVGLNELGAVYTHIADIHAKEGEKVKTLEALSSARVSILANYDKSHKNYLAVLQKQIYILLQIGELQKAEEMIAEYTIHFDARNETLANDLLFSNLKMGLYSSELNFNLASYNRSPNDAVLEAGIAAAEKVVAFQDEVLETISDRENKLYFFSAAYSNFTTAVFLLIQKYERSGESKYLDQAFLLTEKTKYYSQRESRGLRYPQLESVVPAALIESEKGAKIELNQVISKYENLLDGKSDPDQMLGLIQQIDSLKQVHKNTIVELAEASPLLTNYINDKAPIDLPIARKYLADLDRDYVSYFLSSNELLEEHYAFVLQNGNLNYVALPCNIDSLNQTIETLLISLKLDLGKAISEGQLKEYEKPCSLLYSWLIAPLNLEDKKGVVFNLHGKIHSLPLEVLVNTSSRQFLIQERPIAYAYSLASMLAAVKIDYDKGVLSCSPPFEKRGTLGLRPLVNTEKETRKIENLLGAADAVRVESKDDYQAEITNHKFNIIHLATHASANHKKGFQSYLAFGNEEADLLYSREIYGLPIHANLVVLSTCESGDGEYIESQGILGLATAFSATATQSMVASLWEVNDATSFQVIVDYYKYLKEGSTKDKALQQSKINYLASVPKSKQHPYYWAGFIQLGSIDALNFEQGLWSFIKANFIWGVIGLLILLLISIGLKNKAAPNK